MGKYIRFNYYNIIICVFCFLVSSLSLKAQLIVLPERPSLTQEGYNLIVEFETGGEKQYNRWPHPEWPGGYSGITEGCGYDNGYNREDVIRKDWKSLGENNVNRLAKTSGITGIKAKPLVYNLYNILISWDLALDVFNNVTVTRFYLLTKRTYPNFDNLRPNAQAALISLTFNRGSNMIGDKRYEMRKIKECAAKQDYSGMAYWNRKSIRVWRGTDIYNGMARRREAEAKLMETP